MITSAALKAILDTNLIPLVRTVTGDSLRDAAAFRFDKHHPQQLTVVCVYATLLELAHGELALLNADHATTLPVVLRSMFEAYADCRAAIENPSYHKSMYATLVQERIRFIGNVEKSKANPFFVAINARLDAAAEIAKLTEELEQYKKEGHPPLSTRARFEAGKLEHEYQSMYWLLCLEGHNNMTALDDRHIEKHGDDFEVVLFKEVNPHDTIRIVDSLTALLIDSAIQVHKFIGTDCVTTYETHQKRLNEIRGGYTNA